MSVDVLLLVPFEPNSGASIDPVYRQTQGAKLSLPFAIATEEFESFLGRSLDFWKREQQPYFGDTPIPLPTHRSLTAVTLASALENNGISWYALDPGCEGLMYWRQRFEELQSLKPRIVALSTTFVMTAPWLHAICRLIRKLFPYAKLLIGGYYYATNAQQFLSLDADVMCVGEGELRFPEVVKRLLKSEGLQNIPGLYLRASDGTLHHTGHAESLNLGELPPVQWSLAERIDPFVDLSKHSIEYGVETQRGCIFKCEFCSYRTLVDPQVMTPEQSVEAILATGASSHGWINLTDSTATFPHRRWEETMRLLAERGGSPHPIWAFARVSDINDDRARLMHAAGVRHLFVGQESGHQEILNRMKKATHVHQVKPAISALEKNGITATFGFIHGFPGENMETIQASRGMIEHLNDGLAKPAVLTYLLYPFIFLDFAAVSQKENLTGTSHYLGYEGSSLSPAQAVEEVLQTIIAVSRKEHAPAFSFLLLKSVLPTSGIGMFSIPQRYEVFRWMKAVERGISIFLEKSLDGTPINDLELRRVREIVLERYPMPAPRRSNSESLLRRRILKRLAREWEVEKTKGPGLMTRFSLGVDTYAATKMFSLGKDIFLRGEIAQASQHKLDAHDNRHAEILVSKAISTKRKYPVIPVRHSASE